MKSEPSPEKNSLPLHVAIIMDGNGRWAKARKMPRKMGHRAGVKTLLKVVNHAFSRGVGTVTLYAFSSENRLRPKDEVDSLIDLIRRNFATTFTDLVKKGVKVVVLGERSFFPDDVVEIIDKIERESREGRAGVFNVALNYGGREELVRAANLAAKRGEITESTLSDALYTAHQPDPDLVIRTGGEMRLSNFLLWQAAYAELFFTDTLWPDFTTAEFDKILAQYAVRDRRFGKVK